MRVEKWKDVEGFPNYMVSNFGKVLSMASGKMIKGWKNNRGYLCFDAFKDGKDKRVYFARLVALHFVPNPENLPEVNHLDGDKENCAAWNLAWTDRSGNMKHAYKTGLHKGYDRKKPPTTN